MITVRLVIAIGLILAGSAACGGGDPPGPETMNPVATVTLSPPSGNLVPEQPLTFTATTRDAQGATLSGRDFTWSSSNSDIASVDRFGVVKGETPGGATITATSEGKTANAAITVAEGKYINATGGTVAHTNGNITIEIPVGARTAGTAISIYEQPSPELHAGLIPGTAYTLRPNGTNFALRVTVNIRYGDAQLPAGADPTLFVVHRWDGSNWNPLTNTTRDIPNRIISGQTTGFSDFAIIQLPGGTHY